MKTHNQFFIILTSEFPPEMYGGIAYWAKNLLGTLTRLGYNATVLTHLNQRQKVFDVLSTKNVRYISGHDWNKFHWLYRLPHLLKLLFTKKNVVIIAATWDEIQVVHHLKKFFGFRIYCSSHGTDITKHVYPKKAKTLKSINSVFKSVDLFMPVSRSLEKRARSMFSNLSCNSIVLGCNVNTDLFRPETDQQNKIRLREKLAINPASQLLISIGRMLGVKGFRQVIMALPEIRKRIPDILYMIVATPLEPEYSLLKHLISELKLERHVIFQPPVRNSALPEILQAADVFVLTSEPIYFPHYQEEGLPRVIAEASACGLPVVVSTTGGLAEAVIDNETGFIVPHGDQDCLKNSIIALLTDKEMAHKMGNNGRSFVINKFSEQAMTEKILLMAQADQREHL